MRKDREKQRIQYEKLGNYNNMNFIHQKPKVLAYLGYEKNIKQKKRCN